MDKPLSDKREFTNVTKSNELLDILNMPGNVVRWMKNPENGEIKVHRLDIENALRIAHYFDNKVVLWQ